MKEFIPIQQKCHSFKDEKWPLSEQFKNKEEIHPYYGLFGGVLWMA